MVVAAQAVGAHQDFPLPPRGLGRAKRERQQRLAVIAPAAKILQPRFPAVIERLADEQAALARKLVIEAARQREAFPVVLRIMPEGADAHVEVKVEFGFGRRSRVWWRGRQARSGSSCFIKRHVRMFLVF